MSINITQLKTELGAFFRKHSNEIRAMVYSDEVMINKYTRPITKVKGKFPAMHSVASHVVQGFQAVWNELGGIKIKVNELVNYHQKVNFPIVPAEIEGSWLAWMNEESKGLKDKSISRYIMNEELKPKVIADIETLSGDAVYDATKLDEFGYSMNGLKKILNDAAANSENPLYKIQLLAIDDDTIVDEVTKFERAIPKSIRKFITKIYMSTNNLERYVIDYENQFGANTLIKSGDMMKTRLGKRMIVGLDCLDDPDFSYIFATPDRNFLRLIDEFDKPQITDIQTLDYKVKIFMEWWLGYAFWTNQLVLMAAFDSSASGAVEGLGSATDDDDYYAIGAIPSSSGSASASGS